MDKHQQSETALLLAEDRYSLTIFLKIWALYISIQLLLWRQQQYLQQNFYQLMTQVLGMVSGPKIHYPNLQCLQQNLMLLFFVIFPSVPASQIRADAASAQFWSFLIYFIFSTVDNPSLVRYTKAIKKAVFYDYRWKGKMIKIYFNTLTVIHQLRFAKMYSLK